jgi:hypothetical protein
LLRGTSDGERTGSSLFLQVKEARRSVLEAYAGKSIGIVNGVRTMGRSPKSFR